MFGQVLAITRNTFIESVRQPIFVVLLLAGGILQILNVMVSVYSMGYTDTSEVTGDDKLLLDIGLATIFGIATLLAAFIATSVISREIENKTALTVISKPVGRPIFVVGKYLGVTAAVLVAGLILTLFFYLALRQGVMSTVRDRVDLPVLLFSFLALGVSVGLGVWGNFFYGWVFSSTTVFTMLPSFLIAWGLTLLIGKDWSIQPITTDFLPQITIASVCVLMALPVLTGVAVAASTRLGQVMTIVICAGVFLLGLLSNHLIGRVAFQNDVIAMIDVAEPVNDRDEDFRDAGDVWRIELASDPGADLQRGMSVYYGPAPNGVLLVVPAHTPFDGDVTSEREVFEALSPAITIRSADNDALEYEIVNVGGMSVSRPPRSGDYLFLRPTEVNPIAWGVWSIIPNMQFFWLVDAVTQTHDIPPRYVGLAAIYTGVQTIGLLAISVFLFQRREVG